MPFKSQAQRRWMFAAADRGEVSKSMPHEWAHHTPNMKSLPEHVGHKKKKKTMNKSCSVSGITQEAADTALLQKLASDTGVSQDALMHLAGYARLSPVAFAKAAYADPVGYVAFLKVATGASTAAEQVKQAMAKSAKVPALLVRAVQYMGRKGQAAGRALGSAGRTVGKTLGSGAETLTGKDTAARRAIVGAAGTAGVGLTTGGLHRATRSTPQPLPQGNPTPAAQAGGTTPGGSPPSPSPEGQQPAGGSANNPPGRGGMSPRSKALLAVGGVGVGALGAGALLRRRQKKQQQELKMASATLAERGKGIMKKAIAIKVAAFQRKQAADTLVSYLDVVVKHVPLEKSAHVRQLQASVAAGKDLTAAIKVAYPQLTGEERGILASQLVRGAVSWRDKQKSANAAMGYGGGMGGMGGMPGMGGLGASPAGAGASPTAGMPTTSPQSWSGPMAQAPGQMSAMGV